MKEKLRFATVFPYMENFHLIKDPGMIPYTMQEKFGYDSVVPLSSLCEYEYKDGFYSEISTPIINDRGSQIGRKIARRIFWIAKNARKIDVLHLFFVDKVVFLTIYVYRLFNPHGLVYVHCDTDGEHLLNYTPPRNILKKIVIKTFLSQKNLDNTLWGIQNKKNAERIQGHWPFVNVKYIPNGFDWGEDASADKIKKEDIVLTVARNGTEEKRTDLLLDAFALVADRHPSWRLELVGTVEEKFKPFINSYFNKFPTLRDRVTFVGPIFARNELQKHFAKAKVFALPSEHEGFPLVTVEAMSQGCFVVGSDIPATVELVSGGYGCVFNNGDLNDFVKKLEDILDSEQLSEKKLNQIAQHANDCFRWENVLSPVHLWINEKVSKKSR